MVNQALGTQDTTSAENVAEELLSKPTTDGHHHVDACNNGFHSERDHSNGHSAANGHHEDSMKVVYTGKSEGEYVNFDPHKYAQTYYETISGGRDDWDYVPKALKFWLETFSREEFCGDELLELGVGPILLPAIFASRRFKRIYLSDYADVNIKAIRMWIDKHPDAYNWLPFCDYVAKKEKSGLTAPELELRVRNAVRDVFFCDINNENPLAPQPPRQFDCVIAAGVLECGSANHEAYKRNVRNIASLVKPGGYILADGDLNENFYYVNDQKFFILNLDAAFIRAAFEEAGFEELEFLEFQYDASERSTIDMFDAQGYWQLRARKRP